ncbi:MAG: M56 family metallopeptidase [Isosphaeraceae bacterium]
MPAGLILAAWLLVASLLATRLAIGQARMARLRRLAAVAEPHERELCAELARHLGVQPPGVLRSPFLHSPCLDGLRRPAILLPEDADQNLRETLVHELAHLVRRDAHWNLLRHSATVLGWYQPLLWILARRLEATSEEVCDDFVVQIGTDRARYAGHLLALARRTLPPPSPTMVGMVSLRSMLARRVVRILDASRRPCTRLGVRAAGLILAAGVAATGLVGLLGAGQAAREVKEKGPEAGSSPDGGPTAARADAGRVSGQVVGPDGKPLAGATVIASRSRYRTEGFGGTYQNARTYQSMRGTTDRDGRFTLDLAAPLPDTNLDPKSPEADQRFQVVATAPGLGLSYQVPGSPIRLRADDLPITGRLVDLEGRPVGGARVRIRQLYLRPRDHDPAAGEAGRSPEDVRSGRSVLDGEPILPGGVATNADGRFRIEGLGRDVMALLEISGPRVAFQRVSVMTRPMPSEPDSGTTPGRVPSTGRGSTGPTARFPSSRRDRNRGARRPRRDADKPACRPRRPRPVLSAGLVSATGASVQDGWHCCAWRTLETAIS